MLSHFENVFKKFAQADEDDAADNNVEDDGNSSDEMDMDMDDDEDEMTKKLSSRAKRERSRLTVAQLKQLVAHPDVVEDHDVTAADSRLLVHLKSYKCTVPVPKHWCQKRKYLQGTYFVNKVSVVDTRGCSRVSWVSRVSRVSLMSSLFSCPLCSLVRALVFLKANRGMKQVSINCRLRYWRPALIK